MNTFNKWLMRAFPAPEYITMPAVALDISPNSVKLLSSTVSANGYLPKVYERIALEAGVIENGHVLNPQALTDVLKGLRIQHELTDAFVSIPESSLYLYTMSIKGAFNDRSIRQRIEFDFNKYVPFSVQESLYDYDKVVWGEAGGLVSVTVVQRSTIELYQSIFADAGIHLRTIEPEVHAIARSVSTQGGGIEMVVDVGVSRSEIIVSKESVPIFAVTVESGADDAKGVVDGCSTYYRFWDAKGTGGKEDITKIILCGGGATTVLAESIKSELNVPTELADVWQYLFTTGGDILSVNNDEALSMATLAGLLLNNQT